MDYIKEELKFIDPAALSYQEWLSVGMGLKQEGYDVSLWDEWSRRDLARYHAGECERKWETFVGSSKPVTGGTIYQMALAGGYVPPQAEPDRALSWDSVISDDGDHVVVKKGWLDLEALPKPQGSWTHGGKYCADDAIKYLELLFDEDEFVGVSCSSWEDSTGRKCPATGVYSKTAGQLIKEIHKYKGDLGAVFGDYSKDAGAWIRFNPLDGKGVKNDNVTSYRYCLIESDQTSIEQQYAIIKELELPVVALVYSGGKSVHAITRIDARSLEEYRRRVDFTYSVCQKNGLIVDVQNRNPSRLSRLPGVCRKDKKQYLIASNIGKSTWEEWREWIDAVNDDLPDPEGLSATWDDLPPLAPPLIEGVLRQGHKMLIAGASKAGKSYALIELCCALAEGKKWLSFDVAQGRVLYVNLELDRASCLHRFKDVYAALGWEPENIKNIDIWNLRGKSVPMDKLAPKLIRRAKKSNYVAVIIDPIYKVITGDENSADQMAHFCNQFDKICTELGTAVIYCHHHSKGYQGGKRSMDRASGSGVFARDPDALMDLTELEITEKARKEIKDKLRRETYCHILKTLAPQVWPLISTYAKGSADMLRQECEKALPQNVRLLISAEEQKIDEKMKGVTAWRIDGVLREFASFATRDVLFCHPLHDDSAEIAEILKNLDPVRERAPWEKAAEKKKKQSEEKMDELVLAVDALQAQGIPTTYANLADYLGIAIKTVRRKVAGNGNLTAVKNGESEANARKDEHLIIRCDTIKMQRTD